ncbi:TIGR03089 family protein [Mycolicibacterium doricum]|uniref:Acetyl-CoA synthetase n=1 Tax=Mycolicibacterium doricum TaxID=126673 RepID=A0A1X1TBS9_9MYCO|nr:TIGR03089 family protein [Mycolicibacterium doricum]MCV7267551.1 TIGR03089 family protein [Mycolicibacterium doricum]ORV42034.1 acetyl-CoA synthetase [Mycolicibacterium doricum]BBZ06731.1 TIGR03089 family protein [Mycolicibacterium doricum]
MCQLTVTAALLAPLLDSDPAGPSVTYYDDATGERIEVSNVTLANWAAKTGNLLRDELGAGPATRVAILLPAHWQTAAVLFGLWWIGAEALVGGASSMDGADIALCTADLIDQADAAVGTGEIAVLSLDPFGKPVADLPVGLTDYATAVRVHGDQIVPERAPGPALNGRSVDEVLAAAARAATAAGLRARDRVLSTADWATADDVVGRLLAVYTVGGSLVQVAHPDAAALERRRAMEKITRDLG